MAKTLSEQARAFLQERRYAVLATINADGTPQLSAMWYRLDGDTIVMNTKVGRIKERNMRRDPRVSVCFEDEGYLTINGTVEFIEDQATAQEDIYRLAVRYDGEEAARKQMEKQFSKEQRVTLHIKCEHIIENLW
jgi:PPOX class probable F420-dependent enzyme